MNDLPKKEEAKKELAPAPPMNNLSSKLIGNQKDVPELEEPKQELQIPKKRGSLKIEPEKVQSKYFSKIERLDKQDYKQSVLRKRSGRETGACLPPLR